MDKNEMLLLLFWNFIVSSRENQIGAVFNKCYSLICYLGERESLDSRGIARDCTVPFYWAWGEEGVVVDAIDLTRGIQSDLTTSYPLFCFDSSFDFENNFNQNYRLPKKLSQSILSHFSTIFLF